MESLNVDEIIIDFVRENHCLYDKCDVNFKNVSKKEFCGKKSINLRNCYDICQIFYLLNYYYLI